MRGHDQNHDQPLRATLEWVHEASSMLPSCGITLFAHAGPAQRLGRTRSSDLPPAPTQSSPSARSLPSRNGAHCRLPPECGRTYRTDAGCRLGRGPALSRAAPETSAFPAMQDWPAFAETAPETPALSMMARLRRPSAGSRWAAVGQQPRISMLRSPRINRHREIKPVHLQALLRWSQPGSNR